jgi:hypothetical protein
MKVFSSTFIFPFGSILKTQIPRIADPETFTPDSDPVGTFSLDSMITFRKILLSFESTNSQCCGSESGIGCPFDPWIRDG